jgi:hypothetical protein
MKEIQNKFILSFNKEEMSNSRIRKIIRELIDIKMNIQKYNDYVTITPAEFEIIRVFSEFVDKRKYNNQITFKGEVGKIKGKKLVVK